MDGFRPPHIWHQARPYARASPDHGIRRHSLQLDLGFAALQLCTLLVTCCGEPHIARRQYMMIDAHPQHPQCESNTVNTVITITIDYTRKNCSAAAEGFECHQTVSPKVCRMIQARHNVAELGTLSLAGKMYLAHHPPGLCWVDSGPSAPAFQVHYLGQGQSYS